LSGDFHALAAHLAQLAQARLLQLFRVADIKQHGMVFPQGSGAA
jgi:hypothetical protein